MKRDIRKIFKNNEFQKKKLPDFHEEDFFEKLKTLNKKEKPKSIFKIWKVAASIVLVFSVGYYVLNLKTENNSTLITQVKQIEKEYLTNIEKEWQQFMDVAKDSVLVKKYKVKMSEFDIDYKRITNQFKKSPNNINVLESLIDNLQRRLELIKNIKEHIKELNQKNTSNETIYL